jgi:predicted lysophospholipase L1 biosynthesis ABC-type transport system permease subunit
VVVNESLSKLLFPDTEPVGKQISVGEARYRVIGVCGDIRRREVEVAEGPFFYRPLFQSYRPMVTLQVRSRKNPRGLLEAVASEIRRADPALAVFNRSLMRELVNEATARSRIAATVAWWSGFVALGLTLLGIHSVVSLGARGRDREIAIRLALGAPRRHVVLRLLRDTGLVILAGVLLGIPLAQALGKYLADLFIEGTQPWRAYLAAALAISVLAALIAVAGALQKARIQPAATLSVT